MTWAKIDDQLHAHRKAKRAWRAHRGALGLHLLAISYSAGQLTDGVIDREFVEEKLPSAAERKRVVAALVDAGLWAPNGDGWQINDWLEYNPSRADVLAKRERESARKARARAADAAQTDNGVRGRLPHARAGAPAPAARPDPLSPNTPPDPPSRGGRTRDRIRYEGELAEFSARHFPGVPAGLVAQQAAQLRSRGKEPTPDALRPLIERWQEAPTP